ncbi:MAG: cupin domain-containing protein [Gammaproteobacteria bacterium]|nr:cupin domain-containing protein [Gammaproteobacteria bacterium]
MSIAELQAVNWDKVELETVNPRLKRRIVTGKLMTVARIYIADGFTVPLHSHLNEQVTQVISGRMRFVFGENREGELELGPGDVVVIPANLPHEATAIGDVEEMDMWAPRRQDWLDGTDDYLRE